MENLNRILKLQALLEEQKIDALIVDYPINLYYLTGLSLSSGSLVISQKAFFLLVDGRYIEQCTKQTQIPTFLSSVVSLKDLFSKWLIDIHTIAFCEKHTSYRSYSELQKTIEQITDRNLTCRPVEDLVEQLRAIKEPEEIQLMRKAAVLGSRGYDFICQNLKEGITEKELASELEIFWKREGSDKIAFDPIIAFGSNTSMPHYHSGSARLKKGDPVLIDIGVTLNHYHSDMTRMQFFGEPDPRIKVIYTVVKESQQAALALCRPGTTVAELDQEARRVIAEKGYSDYFPHSLGHGIGLEVHEMPILRNKPPYDVMKLLPGMIITIEPGVYLPDVGGVRLEDTVLITSEGHENLTKREII